MTALLATLLFVQATPGAPSVRIDAVWIAIAVADGPATDAEAWAKLGQRVTGSVVIEATVAGKRALFSEAKVVVHRGKKLTPQRWPKAWEKPEVRWALLEADPKGRLFDNTGTMERSWYPDERKAHPASWHWCPIDVAESPLAWGKHTLTHRLDARPKRTPDTFGGLGTFRYVVELRWRGQTVRSRGAAHRDKTGLLPGIATVRVRRDDTPVGYMTELVNVPYVFGSSTATKSDTDHQAERAVGADCADLVVYGWRRAAVVQRKTPPKYTYTGGLKTMTKRVAYVDTVENGVYRTGDGRPVKFGRDVEVGDLLLWKGHVAVVAERDPSGYFTPKTKILHTVIESAALVPFEKIGFGFDTMPFDVRRK